jgi:hypothetical protein
VSSNERYAGPVPPDLIERLRALVERPIPIRPDQTYALDGGNGFGIFGASGNYLLRCIQRLKEAIAAYDDGDPVGATAILHGIEADARDNRTTFIACVPIGSAVDGQGPPPGYQTLACRECSAAVWASPRTIAMVELGSIPLCAECAEALMRLTRFPR